MASRPSLLLALSLCLAVMASLPARATEGVIATAALLHKAALTTGTLTRESTFVHKLFRPEKPSGRVMILMHGSGGDETTLVSLASRVAPHATLVGIRGRVVQDGVKRWYRRLTPTEFDQKDVRAEADAFVAFLRDMAREQQIDLSAATFLGYSNGANLIAALTQLHPGIVREAVLLRPMPVLDPAQKVDLSHMRVLTISGENDRLYFPFAAELEARLRGCGASVEARIIESGHGIGDEDARLVAEWLGTGGK